MINRLYKDGETKKMKQNYYEYEKSRRIAEECTFTPNSLKLGQAKTLNVKLYSSKDGDIQVKEGVSTPKITKEKNTA